MSPRIVTAHVLPIYVPLSQPTRRSRAAGALPSGVLAKRSRQVIIGVCIGMAVVAIFAVALVLAKRDGSSGMHYADALFGLYRLLSDGRALLFDLQVVHKCEHLSHVNACVCCFVIAQVTRGSPSYWCCRGWRRSSSICSSTLSDRLWRAQPVCVRVCVCVCVCVYCHLYVR